MAKNGEFKNCGNGFGNYANEWTRTVTNKKINMYLVSYRSCGNCSWIGHYLEIDKKTNKINKKCTNFPHMDQIIMSPDKKKFIAVDFDFDDDLIIDNQKLFLYDLESASIKPLDYKVPKDGTIMSCGHGWFLDSDSVKWLSDNEISIQPQKADADGCANDSTFISTKPTIIKLKN